MATPTRAGSGDPVVCLDAKPLPIYRPRQPRQSPLYKTVERYLPEFERTYDERYGPCRPIIGDVAPDGTFLCLPRIDEQRLLDVWQDKVYELFVKEGNIDPETVDQMRCWPHSGFSVDNRVYLAPHDVAGLRRLRPGFGIAPYFACIEGHVALQRAPIWLPATTSTPGIR